jgi:hypothetical protein
VTQHKSAECHYDECRYAEGCGATWSVSDEEKKFFFHNLPIPQNIFFFVTDGIAYQDKLGHLS